MLILTTLTLSLVGVISALADTACKADNCGRAVSGTRQGSAFLVQATSDCIKFLGPATVTASSAVTVTVTSTRNATVTVSKRANGVSAYSKTIPTYANACTNSAAYTSACSCLGIDVGEFTVITYATTTTTITETTTTIASNSTGTTSSPATCTANLLTDPLNCGQCGKICSTGTCDNGSCSSSQCPQNQTCVGGFKTCGNTNCFCFSDSTGHGFCGQNAVCSGLTSCKGDKDCGTGNGMICALNTCCLAPSSDKPGVCLNGECANPSMNLMRMARMARRENEWDNTAAWLGHH